MKNNWGGNREGSGRKATLKKEKRISFYATKEAVEILENRPNKSDFINEAINAYCSLQKK